MLLLIINSTMYDPTATATDLQNDAGISTNRYDAHNDLGAMEDDNFNEMPKRQKRLKKLKGVEYPDGLDEDLMGDEEDRRYLSSLTHLEREKILEERHTRRQQLIRHSELLKTLKESDNKESPESFLGIESLTKRQFSQLKDESMGPLTNIKRIKEFDSPLKTKKKRRSDGGSNESLNATEDLKKINDICLKRMLLLKLHDHLYFEDAIRDCLVKINTGNVNSRTVYKIGIIKSVTEKPNAPYTFNEKTYTKYLDVAFDSTNWGSVSIINVSNKEIDEHEALKLLENLREVTSFPLNARWVERKLEELNKFVNYKFTSEDIMKINERNLDKIKESKTTGWITKKKLLEDKVHYLESENFLEFSQERYNEILQLRKQIDEVNNQISLEQQAQQQAANRKGGHEKFLEYKSVA